MASYEEMQSRLREFCSDEDLAQMVASLVSEGNIPQAKLLLRKHRKTLMDELHICEKKVDALDLLVYQLEKQKI